MGVTIKDVAKLAGVSTATVSYVINAKRDIPKKTQEKVRRAMRQLEYLPSAVARSLRARRSHTVGLIVPQIDNQYFTNVAHGIEAVLQKNGYSLVISESRDDPKTERKLIQTFNSMLIDGLIIIACGARHGTLKKVLPGDYPVVFADRRPTGFAGDVVALDNFTSTHNAIAMLLDRGHERIAMIGGAKWYSTTKDRMAGYVKAHKDRNRDIDPELVRFGDYSMETGIRFGECLLRDRPPSAIFCASPKVTLGIFVTARKMGLSLPGQLALIGCEDEDWATATEPPLTMINQPSIDMGKKSAELILKRISHPSENFEAIFLPTHMVVRGST